MNANDLLRRAEQRAMASRVARWSIAALVFLAAEFGAAAFIHHRGVAEGRALEQTAQTVQALKDNAHQLRAAQVHADSTRTEAVQATTAATTLRDSSRATVARVHIVTDTMIIIDTLPPVVLPKAGVDAFRDLLAGRLRDSLALVKDSVLIQSLQSENLLLVQRDSLHTRYEGQLKDQASTAERRGFWRGVEVGATGVLVAIVAVVVAAH